jgi:hypothetical protein
VSRIEPLLAWLIPLGILGFLAHFFAMDLAIAQSDPSQSYLGLSKVQLAVLAKVVPSAAYVLQCVFIGIWLVPASKAAGRSSLLWGGFGFFFGLWALAIWLLCERRPQPGAPV